MKANQLQYEECVKIYEKEGASGVYHFAKENLITDWSECYSCETETPDCDDGACLVCGCDKDSSPAFNNQTTNQIKTYEVTIKCEITKTFSIFAKNEAEAVEDATDLFNPYSGECEEKYNQEVIEIKEIE